MIKVPPLWEQHQDAFCFIIGMEFPMSCNLDNAVNIKDGVTYHILAWPKTYDFFISNDVFRDKGFNLARFSVEILKRVIE